MAVMKELTLAVWRARVGGAGKKQTSYSVYLQGAIIKEIKKSMTASTEVGVHFFSETPCHYFSDEVQRFIDQEVHKPSKIWAKQVVECERETENVKLRTDDFVLLPDLVSSRRQFRSYESRQLMPLYPCRRRAVESECGFGFKVTGKQQPLRFDELEGPREPPSRSVNWLAIVTDPSVRTIRDLRGDHLPMLEEMYESCMGVIMNETKLERHNIMAFANYPPSVYKLHFHFCAPFFKSSAYDGFRMHPLSTIINNLRLCPDYYRLSTLDVPLHVHSELYRVVSGRAQEDRRMNQKDT